jgi:hypothetical protein
LFRALTENEHTPLIVLQRLAAIMDGERRWRNLRDNIAGNIILRIEGQAYVQELFRKDKTGSEEYMADRKKRVKNVRAEELRLLTMSGFEHDKAVGLIGVAVRYGELGLTIDARRLLNKVERAGANAEQSLRLYALLALAYAEHLADFDKARALIMRCSEQDKSFNAQEYLDTINEFERNKDLLDISFTPLIPSLDLAKDGIGALPKFDGWTVFGLAGIAKGWQEIAPLDIMNQSASLASTFFALAGVAAAVIAVIFIYTKR